MRKAGVLVLALTLSGLFAPGAEAEWWVDARELHISAHMENSCQDCHADIADRDRHPDPARIGSAPEGSFSVDACLDCHDDVMDDVDVGIHGGREIPDGEGLADCTGCHRPHTQPRLGENRIGEFDASRPEHEQCGACHEERASLPDVYPEDEACMACHGLVDPGSPQGAEQIARLCFHCHGSAGGEAQEWTGAAVTPIDTQAYASLPHADLACTECHVDAAGYDHANQELGDCTRCHLPHDEKVAGDAHVGVSCGACHLAGIEPVRDSQSRLVGWNRDADAEAPVRVHEMAGMGDESACRRCHVEGNEVGAAAALLPAKSILCMSCHSATLSAGDATTVTSLIVFLVGMVSVGSYWLSGSVAGRNEMGPVGKLFRLLRDVVRAVFSLRLLSILKIAVLDVLLQRRLYRQSPSRWLIHSLIFYPFVFRFSWGLVALVASLSNPEWALVWPMLDKNNPATALFFDLTGISVLLGIGLAFHRGQRRRQDQLPSLPGQDRIALGLIAGIVTVGFALEGIRIAMTGWPEGAGFAVVGYAISLLLGESAAWTGVYGFIWYAHAILTGAFVAYLPFSRLLHIIVAPVVLALAAAADRGPDRSDP